MNNVVYKPSNSRIEQNLKKCKKEIEILEEEGNIIKLHHYLFDFARRYYHEFRYCVKYYSKILNASLLKKQYKEDEYLYYWSCCGSTSPKFHHHYANFVPIKLKKD